MIYLPDQTDVQIFMPYFEALASEAEFVLELGMGNGNGSTRAFERGLKRSMKPGKLFISVDNDATRPQVRPTVEYWYPVYGDSRDMMTAMQVDFLSLCARPDILYIDTDHQYENMQRELEVWGPVAGPNTLWLFHDTWMFGPYNHMTDAIKEYCERKPEWEYMDVSRDSHGLGAMRWKQSPI